MDRVGCLPLSLAMLAGYVVFVFAMRTLYPVTQESYEKCVADVLAKQRENVRICVQERLGDDLNKSRVELLVLPSAAEHQAACQFIWRNTPENRCRRPSNLN
jgi:hypothetical protein